jgi:hypothetical protein
VNADVFWKTIQRFDFYANTTSSRAPVVMTFNTFVVSAVILKWQQIVSELQPSRFAVIAGGVLLSVIACASLVSLRFVFRVIAPYHHVTPQGQAPPRSIFFFEDVARYQSSADLLASADAYDEDRMRGDMAAQLHALARSVHDKFEYLRHATWAILYVQMPAAVLLLVLRLAVTTSTTFSTR